MIGISDVFNMVGTNGCTDAATSLAMQGCDPEISIPIYEIFYLKLMYGDKTKGLAGSIQEYNIIRKLTEYCGGVAAIINVMDIDLLEIMGVLCIATPNTGMNVFMKWGDLLVENLNSAEVQMVLEAAHIPVPDIACVAGDLIGKALNMIMDMLVNALQQNLGSCGISLHTWDELPAYYNQVTSSGEMQQMYKFRQMTGAAVF